MVRGKIIVSPLSSTTSATPLESWVLEYVFIILDLLLPERCDNLSICEGGDRTTNMPQLLATMRDGDKTEESLGKD
jgi:hypothetical protein